MEIILNDSEQKLAIYVARKRYESSRKSGIVNAKKGPQSNEQTDLEGIGAEIAFCKMFNVYPDLGEGCPYADAWTLELGSVDVKATKWRKGRILAQPSKINLEKVDNYVLMVGQFPSYRYVGSASSEELLHPQSITDMGHGPVYALNQSQLKQK